MIKIALPIAELKPALIGLGKIVNKRSNLPILSHIKIERTKDGWIALTCTDLDSFVTVRLEQPDDGDAVSFLIPYEELVKITKSSQKNDSLLIRSEKIGSVLSGIIEYAIGNQLAEAKVESLPVEEFPETPRVKGDPISVPDSLRSSIDAALECASTDESRLVLNGAYIDVAEEKCHNIVGTDGRHLFSSNSFSLPLKDSLIIPSHKFLGWKEFNNDGEWQLKADPKAKEDEPPAFFQINSRRSRFIGKQIDGNYPNWKQVVPQTEEFKTSLEFDPASLDQISQTIQRMPCDDIVNFGIGLEWNGHLLRLLGRSANAESWTKVDIEDVKGKGSEIRIFLNRQFLAKALQFGLNKVDFIDPLSPMRFHSAGRQMIIMPTRPNLPASPAAAVENQPEAEERQQVEQPEAAPIDAAQPESNPMITDTSEAPAPPISKLDEAIDAVDSLKSTLQEAVSTLKDLGGKLKAFQREQKAAEREVQAVRSTLRSLQSVKL